LFEKALFLSVIYPSPIHKVIQTKQLDEWAPH